MHFDELQFIFKIGPNVFFSPTTFNIVGLQYCADRQVLNLESCIWNAVLSDSSHHFQDVLLAQPSPFNRRCRIYSGYYFNLHIKYHLLNMLKIKCDINQQYLKTVDLHFVKYE